MCKISTVERSQFMTKFGGKSKGKDSGVCGTETTVQRCVALADCKSTISHCALHLINVRVPNSLMKTVHFWSVQFVVCVLRCVVSHCVVLCLIAKVLRVICRCKEEQFVVAVHFHSSISSNTGTGMARPRSKVDVFAAGFGVGDEGCEREFAARLISMIPSRPSIA